MTEVLKMNKSILNKLLTCLPRRSAAKTGLPSSVFCLLSSVFCLLSFAGCAQNKYTKTIEQLCPPDANKTAAMATAEQVLAEMHFHIEKFDIDAGYIRTAPLSGAQSFEFWRADSVGSFNQTEADMQNIRRAVEININEQAGQLCIDCRTATQRLSLPQSQIAANQQTVMAQQQGDVKKLKLSHEQKATPTWTDLGRDNQLETEILKRIEKQFVATRKDSNK
jgi:hypothetical protein